VLCRPPAGAEGIRCPLPPARGSRELTALRRPLAGEEVIRWPLPPARGFGELTVLHRPPSW